MYSFRVMKQPPAAWFLSSHTCVEVGLFLLAFVFTVLASATSITALDQSIEALDYTGKG